MARELAKAYEPHGIEGRWAEFWVKEALFKADPSAPGPVFSIDAARGCAAIGGTRDRLPQAGTGGIREARVEMEGRERRRDFAADAADWGKLRLVAGKIHSLARAFEGGARSFCASP